MLGGLERSVELVKRGCRRQIYEFTANNRG